ncbi:MAG: choice-of-anchor K domain-containing protein [Rhodocyclaceae bacterium]|nr:choice-of-anchor K domain-containing protein [Rhodocyclaceae bacterium]
MPKQALPRRRTGRGFAVSPFIAAVALAAGSTVVHAGSGDVRFSFTWFSGPHTVTTAFGPTIGRVNGDVVPNVAATTPTGYGGWNLIGDMSLTPYSASTADSGLGGTASVDLRYDWVTPPSIFENRISFTPRSFTGVSVGEDFVLGTLSFQNGAWFGAGATPDLNLPSQFGFTIQTVSGDGAAFNQSISGSIVMAVHSPLDNDTSTLAGQEAEADWIYLSSSAFIGAAPALRVFDTCCRPSGATSVGSVDVVARFNSLDLVGFANPTGGAFITAGTAPLPASGPMPPVPEPETYAMFLTGLGLMATLARRRTAAQGAA